MSLCLSFGHPVLLDPSLRWEYKVCFGSLLSPGIPNLDFLEVHFQPKCRCRFRERADCASFLSFTNAMTAANISLRTRTFQDFQADLNWQTLNRFALSLFCIHTPWVESVKVSDKSVERKTENNVVGKNSGLFHSVPNLKWFSHPG